MKKAFINGFLGIAFVFAMASCGGNATTEDTTVADTTGATMEQHECQHHCQMTCPDSTCLAANCENCACPEDSPCHKKECKGEGNCQKGEGECCKAKAEGEGCANAEGCKKECEKSK